MTRTEKNFADWEKSVFGFGYGDGELHIVPLVRAFLVGCNGGAGRNQYDFREQEAALTPAVAWFIINALCKADMIEYGTSPRFGWLTDKGEALKHFMLSRAEDILVRLATGVDDDDDDPGNTCYPDACNCGPNGYEKGRVCVNPFWQDDAARSYCAAGREHAVTDYADLEKRLRHALSSSLEREAADALASLQKAVALADAKLGLAMVYAGDAAAADHRAQSAPAARAAITHIRNARGDLGAFLSRAQPGQDDAP
jgi:hypothetical protein